LGLLSPRIIDAIKAKYERRELAAAIRSEAEDLQYRVAITSFLLAQRYGEVSRDYLIWLKPKLIQYKGNEPVELVRKFVEQLLVAEPEQLLAVAEHLRAKEGVGLSLKRFNASLIESSLATLRTFPVEYQRKIHEFRNQLSVLNQEIERALDSHRMTFDSSISEQNHDRLTADLKEKYKIIQGMCMRVSDRIQSVIDHDPSKI
jgi:hypothetical protein